MGLDLSCDVVVIGGGIIGASATQHLAAAGFSTVLVEMGDYAGATSSRTSRLQHCGLTYFSPGQSIWSLARDPAGTARAMELAQRAMRGRSEFLRTTPERLTRLEFLTPLYDDGSIPVWKARLGFRLLDWLDRSGEPLEMSVLDRAAIRQHRAASLLRDPDRLLGVVSFAEYQFDWPERVTVDAVMNARDHGAQAFNRVKVTGIERAGADLYRVAVMDLRSGEAGTVTARSLVNAAGVWVDGVSAMLGERAPRLNTGAKGTNVMVRLPEEFRGIGLETIMNDGMPFYLIPWDDLHFFGPVDSPADPSPENYRATEDEVAVLIAEMNRMVPSLKLKRSDVLYTWAGVRPRSWKAGGSELGTSGTTIHDLGRHGLDNVFVYTGGLYMTHRHAGRTIARSVGERVRASGAAREPVYRPRPWPERANAPAIGSAYPGVTANDLVHAAAHEQVGTLDDLLFRRVRVGWSQSLGTDVAHDAARIVAPTLGWSQAEADAEAQRYVDYVRREFQPRS